LPQGSHLKVTPRVGLLTPQSSMRVQVAFAPPAAQQAATAATGAAAPAAAGNGGAGAAAVAAGGAAAATNQQQAQQQQQQEGQGPLTASASGQYREWLLPCYVKQAPTPVSSSSSSSSSHTASTGQGAPSSSSGGGGDAAGSSSSSSADYVLHVYVTTCSISPEVLLVSAGMPKPSGKNYWVLDFGALPVGERRTRELLLQNTGVCLRLHRCCPHGNANTAPCPVLQLHGGILCLPLA
jgi:hypothetical protein